MSEKLSNIDNEIIKLKISYKNSILIEEELNYSLIILQLKDINDFNIDLLNKMLDLNQTDNYILKIKHNMLGYYNKFIFVDNNINLFGKNMNLFNDTTILFYEIYKDINIKYKKYNDYFQNNEKSQIILDKIKYLLKKQFELNL
tara:strand:- start:12097 stop:12528 length:432 start_codon:yes stop_codon:yes gene_type:complete